MNNQELADKVVALGVGRKYTDATGVEHNFYISNDESFTSSGRHPKDFVRDWRVAGALMEKMSCMAISVACQQSDGMQYHGWLKDPREIIEKCVDALL